MPAFQPDSATVYTLAELVDIAEKNNPETRVAWENAKARAADLGVSKATLYPTLAALAIADSARVDILFNTDWIRQTTGTFSPTLSLDYIIFDFGKRLQEIAISRSNLLAANFLFNDTHRKVIFQVMEAYYRVLNSKGQEEAQEANLKNAQTVQHAAEARLLRGWRLCPTSWKRAAPLHRPTTICRLRSARRRLRKGIWRMRSAFRPLSRSRSRAFSLTIPQELDDTVEKSDRPGTFATTRPHAAGGGASRRRRGNEGGQDSLSAHLKLRWRWWALALLWPARTVPVFIPPTRNSGMRD